MTRPPDRVSVEPGIVIPPSDSHHTIPDCAQSPIKSGIQEKRSGRSGRTPQSHFIHHPELDLFHHRPRKFAALLSQMIAATAVRRTWPHLLLFGAFSAMVVCLNKLVNGDINVPNTLLTPLGVVMGLVLSYRMSSAYERYAEGRVLWSRIIMASRTWARLVWIHCPDSTKLDMTQLDPRTQEADEVQCIIEKATLVQLGLAFAVAVKHYLRGEEGILYEDLFDLVRFLPSVTLPTALPDPDEAVIASGGVQSTPPWAQRQNTADKVQQSVGEKLTPETTRCSSPTEMSDHSTTCTPHDEPPARHTSHSSALEQFRPAPLKPAPPTPSSAEVRPNLLPASLPPDRQWREAFPFSLFVPRRRRQSDARAGKKMLNRQFRESGGVGQNVPLEVQLFMSTWLAAVQSRGVIDAPTTTELYGALSAFGDALGGLERILTTPIPFSYSAHIVEIAWLYCLLLPFQIVQSFGWLTIPATILAAYIVLGFAWIGDEIENPFWYHRNDLNLDFFTDSIIRKEIEGIIARPFPHPDKWVFTSANKCVSDNVHDVGAKDYAKLGRDMVRRALARKVKRAPRREKGRPLIEKSSPPQMGKETV